MSWLHKQVGSKVVRFVLVVSRNNVVDAFTKILTPEAQIRLTKAFLNPKVVSTWGSVEVYLRQHNLRISLVQGAAPLLQHTTGPSPKVYV